MPCFSCAGASNCSGRLHCRRRVLRICSAIAGKRRSLEAPLHPVLCLEAHGQSAVIRGGKYLKPGQYHLKPVPELCDTSAELRVSFLSSR